MTRSEGHKTVCIVESPGCIRGIRLMRGTGTTGSHYVMSDGCTTVIDRETKINIHNCREPAKSQRGDPRASRKVFSGNFMQLYVAIRAFPSCTGNSGDDRFCPGVGLFICPRLRKAAGHSRGNGKAFPRSITDIHTMPKYGAFQGS